MVGRVARILERTGKMVSVSGFTDKLGKPLEVEVVHAAVMYDCQDSSKNYVCIIRNALNVPEMDECLIPPIMMRLTGIEVNECPKFLSKKPSIEDHSIYFPEKELRIPMYLRGIISSIPCRKPSDDELIDNDGVLEFTPDMDNWDPRSLGLNEQEDAMITHSGEIKGERPRNFVISSLLSRSIDPDLFCNDILDMMGVASVRFLNAKEMMDPKELAGFGM